jgi:hypothetical protein
LACLLHRDSIRAPDLKKEGVMTARLAALMFCALLVAVPAQANSFSIRFGLLSPRGDSRLWAENVATFDYAVNDFNSLFGGVEFDVELNEFVDVAMGVDGYSRSVGSRYRDFVRDDGTEILQTVRLRVVPITFGVRFLPAGKFHVLAPYVTGGLGLYPYEYREEGEFVDFDTAEIFGAVFYDRGVGTGAYAAAGLEASLTPGFLIFGEYRRHFVRAGHGGDFTSFGDFDLDAAQLSLGFTFRF